MIVWQINTPEATPVDAGEVRLRRSALAASAIVDAGHHLHWWSANFFHANKQHRFPGTTTVHIGPRYDITFLHGPGYRRNISILRMIDHRIIAKRFLQLAHKHRIPDIILCSCPTIDLSYAAVHLGLRARIPVVLDIRDLWPDTLSDPFPPPFRQLCKIALLPYRTMVTAACRGATVIIGSTKQFVQWGLAKANRSPSPFDQEFPFGYDEPCLTATERADALAFWRTQGIDPRDRYINICFFGTIGHQFDFDTVLKAAAMLPASSPIRFILCGDGDSLERYRRRCCHSGRVLLPGWVNGAQIWELMRMSHIALAPYKVTENFKNNLPNKAIEYMAGGLPILCSLEEGVLPKLLHTEECGFTYGSDPQRLVEGICSLLAHDERERMGNNARAVFEARYRASEIYARLASHLVAIAEAHPASKSNNGGRW